MLLQEINNINVTDDYSVGYDIAAKADNAISVICTSMELPFKSAFSDLRITLKDTPLNVDRSNIVVLDQPHVHVFFGLLVITIFKDMNDDIKESRIEELCAKTGTILRSVAGNRLIMNKERASFIREVLGGNVQIKLALAMYKIPHNDYKPKAT